MAKAGIVVRLKIRWRRPKLALRSPFCEPCVATAAGQLLRIQKELTRTTATEVAAHRQDRADAAAREPPAASAEVVGAASPALCRLLTVDHPRSSELIHEHAKASGPEGFLDRHLHRAVF